MKHVFTLARLEHLETIEGEYVAVSKVLINNLIKIIKNLELEELVKREYNPLKEPSPSQMGGS